MVAVSVSFDGTVLSLAQSDSDNGIWDKDNSTQTPTQETNFVWNGSPNQSNQASNNVNGIEFEDDAAIDATTPKVVFAKVMMANPGVIDLTVAQGLWYEIGEGANGGTWTYLYFISGLFAGAYPVRETWKVIAIDPNEVAWRDAVTGTVDLTTTDYYAWIADAASSAKTDNVIHARLDYMTYGQGLTLIGGDGGDADGTLDDFLADDFEDDTSTGRYGVILPGADENIINGWLNIGTATATVYNDSNRFLVFPHHLVAEGFSGVDIGMANASNDINLTSYTFKGLGNATVTKFFDSELEVNGTTEVITLVAHGFNTGDLVTYTNDGVANITGLTTGTQYFLNALTVDTLALYAVGATVGRQNAFTDTTRVGLTADGAGTGSNHSLTRDPDTRFDYTVTGTTGVGHTLSACTIDGCRIITGTAELAMTGGFILRTGNIDLDGASMTDVTISTPTLEEGVGLFDPLPSAEIANLTTMDITAGTDGHAMRVTTVGTQDWDHTLSGYWAPAALGWNFSTAQAFTTEQLNTDALHGFTTGDAVYYNDEGGVETIGLTNGNKYYVSVVDTDTVTLHLSKAAAVAGSNSVDLTTSGSETQSLYSSKATIFNDTASGTLTIDVLSGTAPSFRNADGATTVVNNSVTVTITGVAEGTAIKLIANETVGSVTDGDLLKEDLADSTGTMLYSHNYEGDLDILVRARNQGLCNAAIADDGGAQTDETTVSNSATVDDMTLTPVTAVNDDFYLYGHSEQFFRLKQNVSDVGSGFTITWQYWNGAWTNLGSVVDGTSSFSVSGTNIVSWADPGDWVVTTENGQGPFFYVRALIGSVSGPNQALGRSATLDVTRYLPIPPTGELIRTITSTGLTATLSQAVDSIAKFDPLND